MVEKLPLTVDVVVVVDVEVTVLVILAVVVVVEVIVVVIVVGGTTTGITESGLSAGYVAGPLGPIKVTDPPELPLASKTSRSFE